MSAKWQAVPGNLPLLLVSLDDGVWAYDLSNAPFIIVSNSTSVVYLSRNLKFSSEQTLVNAKNHIR
jgi:hypothetical protein